MSWILIAALVLVAAFGPLLWLKPSAKDKRLTALRARARTANLTVDIKPLTALNPRAEERVSAGGAVRDHSRLVALYSLILPKQLRTISGFLLHRAPHAQEASITRAAIAVEPGWYFDPDLEYPPALGWPQSWQALQPLTDRLPEDVLALVLEPRAIGVYWAESAGSEVTSVDQIAWVLAQMSAALTELEAQHQDTISDKDS